MKKRAFSFFALLMVIAQFSTEYAFATTEKTGSSVDKQEQTNSSENSDSEGTEDTDKWIEKEIDEKDYEDTEFTVMHYAYGIYIGEQSSGVDSVIRKDGKIENINGKESTIKHDKAAQKFVEQVARYEDFEETADQTTNPVEYVFAKVRAGQAKRKAMKLIKEKYKTVEVKKALGI